MRSKMKSGQVRFLIAVCIVVICASGAYLLHIHQSRLTEPFVDRHVVIETEEGFVPAELTIRKGETVVFRTQRDTPFWPASSFHPTHLLYEEFDSQEPILPSEEWSFDFDTEGVWTYHDHLDPQKTGVIRVVNSWDIFPKKAVACERLEDSEQMRCFDQVFKKHLKEEGVDAAFEYFKQIYSVYPHVASECHDWMHTLGEQEYVFYTEGDQVVLREEGSLCSYGYYHGFINAMVADTQSLEQAEQFCIDASSENGEHNNGLKDSCMHGIGHSVATLALENQQVWGDVQDVIMRSSLECQRLYPNAAEVCFDGMFHELYTSVGRGDYGLSADAYQESGDLFFYCRSMEGMLAESCYAEFVKLWPYFLGEDKVSVMRYVVSQIPGVLIDSPRVLHSLIRSFIEVDIATGDYAQSISACDIVPQELEKECIRGLAIGFATHGEPGNMHEAGFAFCRDSYTAAQKGMCLESMVQELISRYPKERLRSACQELDVEEKAACASI